MPAIRMVRVRGGGLPPLFADDDEAEKVRGRARVHRHPNAPEIQPSPPAATALSARWCNPGDPAINAILARHAVSLTGLFRKDAPQHETYILRGADHQIIDIAQDLHNLACIRAQSELNLW